jgi:hypothetical protein
LETTSAVSRQILVDQADGAPSLNRIRQEDVTLDATAIEYNLRKLADILSPTLAAAYDDPIIGEDERDSTSQWRSKASSDTSRNWLFAIGIDKYSQLSRLKNSVRDLKTVRDILMEHYTFDREHVMELYDEQATRDNIIKGFEVLAKKVGPNDNVLIYYEGHGVYSRAFRRGYWLPVDAGTESTAQYFPNSDLQAFLGAIRSRSILVISDACFSGTLFPGDEKSVPFRPTLDYIQKVAKLKARQVLTSGGNEPVMGGWMFLDQHSLFAHYMIDRLSNNTNKYLPASTLYEQVKIPVSDKGFQTPEYKTIQNTGDEGGEFVFVRK